MESQNLRNAITVAEKFLEDYSHADSGNVFWALFRALIDLTKENDYYLEAGKPEECKFDNEELTERMIGYTESDALGFDASRMSKEFGKLSERLEGLRPSLVRAAEVLSLNAIPSVVKESSKGGRGRRVEIRLIAQVYDLSDQQVVPVPSISGASRRIQYVVESTPKLPFWARWLQKIDMGGRHRWSLVIFTASPFFTPILAVLASIFLRDISATLAYGVFSFFTLYTLAFCLLFWHLVTALNYNIALLPDWLLPLRLRAAVLEYEVDGSHARKYRIKGASVKVYSAKCPICQNRVYLAKQSGFFNKRIIGVCDRNPIEHKYSFDFTTQSGEKL